MPGDPVVVGHFPLHGRPQPCARISRSTRLRPTWSPGRAARVDPTGAIGVAARARGSRGSARSEPRRRAPASDGGCRSQAWKPERDTPSVRHTARSGVGLLLRDEPEHAHRVSLSLAKKAAALFKISRSCSSTRTCRRSSRSSSRSSLVRPSRFPARSGPAAPRYAATPSRHRDRRRPHSASGRCLTQLDRLTPKLRRIRLLEIRSPWHGGRSFLPGRTMPTKRSGVHRNRGHSTSTQTLSERRSVVTWNRGPRRPRRRPPEGLKAVRLGPFPVVVLTTCKSQCRTGRGGPNRAARSRSCLGRAFSTVPPCDSTLSRIRSK